MLEPVADLAFILGVGVWRLYVNCRRRRRDRADRARAARLLALRQAGDGVSIESYMLAILPNEDIDKLFSDDA